VIGTPKRADEAAARSDPAISKQLTPRRQNRNVFTGKELAGAIAVLVAAEPAGRGGPVATAANAALNM